MPTRPAKSHVKQDVQAQDTHMMLQKSPGVLPTYWNAMVSTRWMGGFSVLMTGMDYYKMVRVICGVRRWTVQARLRLNVVIWFHFAM